MAGELSPEEKITKIKIGIFFLSVLTQAEEGWPRRVLKKKKKVSFTTSIMRPLPLSPPQEVVIKIIVSFGFHRKRQTRPGRSL